MVIRITATLVLMQMIFASTLIAQSVLPSKYCVNTEGTKIDSSNNGFSPDSLYVSYTESASSLNFKIVNTTDQTVYLFSSYFPKLYHSAKYVHRVSKADQTYKVAFLPLLPYLSTKPTDKLILGSNRMINKGQVLYDFIKLIPQTYYEVNIYYDNLFKNLGDKNSLICDYDTGKNSKFGKIKFKYLSTDQLNGKYKLLFEFAVYDQVNLLCEQSAYYLKEFEFDQQAKDFKKLSIPVELKNYKNSIF